MDHTLASDLASLAGARIFFAHQSVGENILEGLRELVRGAGHDIPIVDVGTAGPLPQACVLHARIGQNERPLTKCADFRRLVDGELAESIDIALLKFCYIDINGETDVEGLFDVYRTTLDELSRRRPGTTFVPVTAPIRHVPGGPGVWARELLGRPNHSKIANRKRHAFNDLLRRTYADRPVFDIAASESTYADGRRERFSYDGVACDNLITAYTDDGGHLNARGRAMVARDLVRCLAEVVAERT